MKYINVLLIVIFLIFGSLSFANTIILECRLSNSKYVGVISLDAVGQGMMRLKPQDKSSDTNWISCPLFIRNIEDISRGVVPTINFVFSKGSCESVPQGFNLDIFTNYIVLYLNVWNEEQINANVRWLTEYHREVCRIDTIRLSDIRLNIGKFKRGLWGKRPPSM